MTDWMETTEGLIRSGRIKLPLRWTVGATGSKFLVTLRDEKRILGNRCPECGSVFVPPKKTCSKCMVDTDEWVEVGSTGEIVNFTIVRKPTDIQPVAVPFAYANIKLDGASCALLHIVKSDDLSRVKTGARVAAVFSETRAGHILDIAYFQPV